MKGERQEARGESRKKTRRTSTVARSRLSPLASRLSRVRLLLCDVDAVLTDGSVFISGGDEEFKQFHIQDGLGLMILRREGIKVGFVSARPSTATTRRAAELQIDFLHQAKGSKVAAIESILAQAGVSWDEVCYIGDDVVDLGALRRAGVAVAVANAIAEVKAAAHYVTQAGGGHGAVREVATMILQAQKKWSAVIEHHESE